MGKPEIAATSPSMESLQANKNYAWCACGKSSSQPWCDGSHKDTEMTPMVFKIEEQDTKAICQCKQTSNPPYCDGSHMNVS